MNVQSIAEMMYKEIRLAELHAKYDMLHDLHEDLVRQMADIESDIKEILE